MKKTMDTTTTAQSIQPDTVETHQFDTIVPFNNIDMDNKETDDNDDKQLKHSIKVANEIRNNNNVMHIQQSHATHSDSRTHILHTHNTKNYNSICGRFKHAAIKQHKQAINQYLQQFEPFIVNTDEYTYNTMDVNVLLQSIPNLQTTLDKCKLPVLTCIQQALKQEEE